MLSPNIAWSLPLLFLATALLFLGHVVRVIRWRGILKHGNIEVSNAKPLIALAIGYFVNLLFPFRSGELFRSGVLAYLIKGDFIFILASVIFERAIDFFVLGLLTPLIFGLSNKNIALGSSFLLASLLIFIFSLLIKYSSIVRKFVWIISNIFNPIIKSSILHLLASLGELWFSSPMLLRLRFWFLTTLMWLFYGLSLFIFSDAIGRSFNKVFSSIYLLPIDQSIVYLLRGNQQNIGAAIFYLSAPLLITLTFIGFIRNIKTLKIRSSLKWITSPEKYITPPTNLRSPKFNSIEHYYSFLDRKFSNEKGLTKEFEDEALNGAIVHRIFCGGSGAVTALVEVSDRLCVRKYASSEFSSGLEVQYNWLKNNSHSLPLVGLGEKYIFPNGVCYDMEFNGSSREFYEVIHTSSPEKSENILKTILDSINKFHLQNYTDDADNLLVNEYIETKVCENFNKIKKLFPEIFELNRIFINERPIQLGIFERFDSSSWVASELTIRKQSKVHGDLTIENILISPGLNDAKNWFLIDPNPINIFSSPLIDFAKLFQSLHLGYEALNRNFHCSLREDMLSVHLHRSSQYKQLYQFLIQYVVRNFSAQTLKEIYLHEIILYLRLIPYQARRDTNRALGFFGVLSLLLLEFQDNFPESFND